MYTNLNINLAVIQYICNIYSILFSIHTSVSYLVPCQFRNSHFRDPIK